MSRVISAFALGSALILSPLLIWQLLSVRKGALRLGDATGPSTGTRHGAEPALNVLLIGDSTVAGVGARTHADGLAGQTADSLHALTGRRVDWRAAGTSGATVRSLLTQLPDDIDSLPDLIVLSIGTNDAVRLRPSWSWSRRLRELLAEIRARFGDAPVLFAGLPPLEHFPALPKPLATIVGATAKALNLAAAEYAGKLQGLECLSFRTDLDLGLFAPDGFHPGPGAYAIWGQDLADLAIRRCALNEAT